MKIFKDVISGDELFSDTFPMKLIDDMYYEIEGKRVTEKTDVSDSMFGGNASADGADADEGADAASATTGINVILSHRLKETGFNKKSYAVYIKGYMKAIKAYLAKENPERVDVFVSKAPAVVKMILAGIADFQFYTGESVDTDAMAIPMNYREDGVTPYFILFKDGLEEEKC